MALRHFLFSLVFIPFLLIGQEMFQVNKEVFYLGSLENFSGHYDSIKVTNPSDELAYIFATTKSRDLEYKLPKKGIGPNESDYIYFISKVKQTGVFNQELKLYSRSGQESIDIQITGKVKSLDVHYDQLCPSFNNPNKKDALNLNARIKVVDKSSQLPIDGAQVKLIKSNKEKVLSTDRDGLTGLMIRLGLYRVITSAAGYNSKDIDHYFNRNSNSITIQLVRNEEQLKDLPLIEDRLDKQDQLLADNKETKKEGTKVIDVVQAEDEKASENFIQPTPQDQNPQKAIYDDPNTFTKGLYKRNNLIFLIDVSNSMGLNNRLNKVKLAMYNLVNKLRPEDYITVITYQERTSVMLERVSALNVDSIETAISGLSPHGSTKGKSAVKRAYEEAKKHKIKDGNNQIILATDGGFDGLGDSQFKMLNHARYMKARHGVNFSILCFGFNRRGKEMLQKLSVAASGTFYEVEKDPSVVDLLEKDIRANALIEQNE